MPKPLSIDLRERIVGAVVAGGSLRVVAARFGVSPSSVSNISRGWRETGSVAPKKMGGDHRSHVIEAHRDRILALVGATPGRPASRAGHVGLGPGFVDEDQPGRIKPPLSLFPNRPGRGNVCPILLGGVRGFF